MNNFYMPTPVGVDVFYEIFPLPFGLVLIAGTAEGVSFLWLGDGVFECDGILESWRKRWRVLSAAENKPDLARVWKTALEAYVRGDSCAVALPLAVEGTVFQKRVWRVLRNIPRGSVMSYRDVAIAVGKPLAARAVAQACARNPVALLIPCHRVISGDGSLSGYAWGVARKKKILEMEGFLMDT